MSLSNNFPTIAPSLNLDFANVKALDPRITFVRTTTATYYGTETAKAEENLLLRSQEFETTWATVGIASRTANNETAPDGTSTADTIRESDSIGVHTLSQTISYLSGAVYTASCFMKAGVGTRSGRIVFPSAAFTSALSAFFDLQNGTVLSVSAGVTASIVSVGNSWYRCVATATATITASASQSFGLGDGSNSSYTGDDTSTLIFWGAQLEIRSTATAYTPTTTEPITNYVPVLETAAAGEARFDHNPLTFESLGLLVEEQRTNLILQSEDLDTTWSETRATLSLDSVVSPSGSLTADVLIANTDNDTHFTSQTFTGTAAAHTFSVYAKSYGLSHVALRLFDGSSQVGLAYYNLSTGATGTVTAGTAAIASVGNGWYRCSLTATLAASASCTADIQLANADNTNSFAGNAFSGVTLWGTQVELGAFSTSFIPTTTATVTRNADAASMSGSAFTSWYVQNDGTVFCEASTFVDISLSRSNAVLAFDPNFFGRGHYIGFSNLAGSSIFTTARSRDAVSQVQANGPTVNRNQFYKIAGVLSNTFRSVVTDGANLSTNSTAKNAPENTHARIGFTQIGGTASLNTLNGYIKKIAYYPQKLSDAQITALTTV